MSHGKRRRLPISKSNDKLKHRSNEKTFFFSADFVSFSFRLFVSMID